MNGITRWQSCWNPLRGMDEVHDHLNTLVNSAFGRAPVCGEDYREENPTVTQWAPLVDITEDDKEYVIKAELPEVKKEDLNVTVENGVLTLTGERKLEKEEKSRKYRRVERAYGTFSRSFTIPDDSDGSEVNAEFKDGVLRVHLAKSEKAKPRTVEVKVS